MGVPKNRGTPKWMVYDGKPGTKIDDLGVPLFLERLIYHNTTSFFAPWKDLGH